MEITRTTRAEGVEIKLKGRMDGTWSDHVAAALAECVRSGEHQVFLEMAAVDYLSSAGIRTLVLCARQLSGIQGRLTVINASEVVRNVLELAGLDELLFAPAKPATPPARPIEGAVARIVLPRPGAIAEVHELDPHATLRVREVGDSREWSAGRTPPEAGTLARFPAEVMGVGLGALVSGDAGLTQPLGEFLAAAGVAVCQPADGGNKPDYLLLEGGLRPEINIAHGVLGEGGFRHLLRFDKGPQQPSLPLSTVVQACLDTSGGELTGAVVVAETAALIGASLQRAPALPSAAGGAQDVFSFPAVRDWLSFTAEPAFANSTCLIVGFAAGHSCGRALRFLRPLVPSGELWGHFHAVALSYHPLRKGRVDLVETVRRLFESEVGLGVLHLLNDWRALSGAGESQFLRGACWCAPAVL